MKRLEKPSTSRLIIVSDSHLAERAVEFRANWDIVSRWIQCAAADMVVHLGDISADGDTCSAELSAAAEVLRGVAPPLLLLPGNHDIGNNPGPGYSLPDVERREHVITESHLQAYRAVFGADHWSVSVPGWQLIGLNAQLFGSGLAAEATQHEWMLKELAQGTGRIGVLIHKPLFRNGPGDSEVHERYLPLAPRQQLLEALRQRNVAFIVSGHTHQTRRYVAEGIEHVWAPSTAFVLPDSLQEPIGDKVVGAMILDLDPNGYSFRLAVPDGLRQYDLMDHEHVYPQIAQVKQKLRAMD